MDAQQQADDAFDFGLMTTEKRPAPASQIGLQSETGRTRQWRLAQNFQCLIASFPDWLMSLALQMMKKAIQQMSLPLSKRWWHPC